jgi:hypothetical protein
VPKGLEMGIGTMVREEKAVIYVASQYLTESPLMPVIEDSEVQFEVELVHFIQVSVIFLANEFVYCCVMYIYCI